MINSSRLMASFETFLKVYPGFESEKLVEAEELSGVSSITNNDRL